MAKTRYKSIFKWIGLYLLANLLGGFLAVALGFRGYESVVAGLVLIAMIVAAVIQRKKGMSPQRGGVDAGHPQA